MSTKPTVLFLDDEERIVRSLRMMFRRDYEVIATTDPQAALAALRERRVHVVVSDQRMPAMTGIEVLRAARDASPNSLRILLTGYAELDAVVASVNEGEIFRFVQKPWDPEQLQATVAKAAQIAQQLFGAEEPVDPAPASSPEGTGILVLDEDTMVAELVRETVQEELADRHAVYWCDTLSDAFDTLAKHRVGVLLSEIRLDDDDISGGLKTLKQYYPEILTVILTSFKDTTALVDLINQGQVYRFLPKPASRNLLARSLASACKYHEALRHAPQRLRSHVVEPLRTEQEHGLGNRLRAFIDRVRRRPDDAYASVQ